MIGQLLDGRYRITRPLGTGGQGEVYLAVDERLYNAKRVVKRLCPAATDAATLAVARRLFTSEAKVLSRLGEHDQIPQLFDHFEENQEFFLVQSFIDGHSLSEELPQGKKLEQAEVLALLKEILQPLAFVHQNEVIHRDIKPPNLIRRDSDGKVVLIDFGAVKEIRSQVVDAQGRAQRTVIVGTGGYMPSEQKVGSPTLSSDVYAVGMIGIQALTGMMPYQLEQDQNLEILWHDLVQADPQLIAILDKMVLYDCRQRYQSAIEALHALEQLSSVDWMAYAPTLVADSQPLIDKPIPLITVEESPSSPLLKQNTKLWWIGGALIAALAGIIASTAFFTYTLNRDKEQVVNRSEVNQQQVVPPLDSDQREEASTPQVEPSPEIQLPDYRTIYQQAILDIESPGHQGAFDKLYLAAEAAIANNQASAMLTNLNQDGAGVLRRMTVGHPEWTVLINALSQADAGSYTLTYERAKLNISGGSDHSREWDLLFEAAKMAIANNQASEMLALLREDASGRFKLLATGHSEWQQLTDALEKEDHTLLKPS